MSTLKISLLALGAVAASLIVFDGRAEAMPMFARKYKMACSGCHEPAPPRLNAVGYKFRRAGFRMPENIGEEENSEFNFSDYISGRIQARQTVSHVSDDTSGSNVSSTSDVFEMREITLYPITGSFMKYFASESELSLAPDQPVEIENSWVRAVYGDKDLWFEARAGIYHPFEGYGGSDRPLSQSRPLFETAAANQTQDTLVRLWGVDHVGAEVGIQWQDFSLSFSVNGRMNTEVEDGKVVAVGITPSTKNERDILVSANQLIGQRSGISALYMHGSVGLPMTPKDFTSGTDMAMFDDTYDRLAGFASTGAGRFTALAGGELGWDDTRDATTGRKTKFKSFGAFGEVDASVTAYAAAFARYDYFDPSTSKDQNQQHGITLGGTLFKDWVYVTPEFQLRTNAGTMGDKITTTGFLHFVALY
ncbi:MAG TPA: hypothetical protein VFT22_07655 [Kofleriaceae bacterium]|nr:hypothetical protein [Kofleriaceae bacterium]